MAQEHEHSTTLSRVAARAATGLVLGLAFGLPAAAGAAERLPGGDPIAFLEKCRQHFDSLHVTGYNTTLAKQESVGGTLQPDEIIDVDVRMQPYSVFMRWEKGARGADRALYVQGANGGRILVHPTGLVGDLMHVVALDPNSSRVRDASRFGIADAGLEKTLVRTLTEWKATRARGIGRIEYLGVRTVPEAGDRPCYVLRRVTTQPEDGVTETTIDIDRDTWFQVGTVLKGPGGDLLGKYFYRDIVLNPAFPPDQFEPAAVER
jgi:hypothetical protein